MSVNQLLKAVVFGQPDLVDVIAISGISSICFRHYERWRLSPVKLTPVAKRLPPSGLVGIMPSL